MDVMRLRELGRHVAEREDALVADLQPSASARQSVAEHAARRRPPPRIVERGLLGAAAGAAAMLLLFVLGLVGRARAPLTFTVEGPRPSAGILKEWVSAPATGSRSLRFSDGSQVVLGAQARARVLRLSAVGAELALEAGRASVNVTHRGDGDWRIRSGPFLVEVTGTRFDVSFSPQTGEFELELHEGRVRVSGCGLTSARFVATGETFKASCREHLPVAANTAAASDSASSPVAPAVPSAPTDSAKSSEASPSAPNAPRRSATRASVLWTELAREGRYQAAYELAKEAGFEEECDRRSAEELVLLGDTARLVGEGQDAERAYRAVRHRFPGSAAAVRAAYALGTLEARSGQHAAAVRWYELSLAEQPSGPFTATALGRMLESLVKLGERKKLESVAKTYLERYPAGAHAEEARRVLNSVPAGE